jgi:signal transduction histidine kinase
VVTARGREVTLMTSLEGAVAARGNRRERGRTGLPHEAGHNQRVTPVAWQPRQALSLSQWVADGQRLGAIGRGVNWWLGDWLRFGNHKFGERYARASRITGYDVQTLMNMVYVATRFEAPRRRDRLSWSHHAELAALDEASQDEWLTRAEDERLSVRDLRAELRRVTRANESEALAAASPEDAQDPCHLCPNCGHQLADAVAS